MKKYIFITIAIFIFTLFASCSSSKSDNNFILTLFASCSSSKSSKCESNCFKVHEEKSFGDKRYEIVTYEDSVKMKRYTFLVVDFCYGGGCTLIDTEDMK